MCFDFDEILPVCVFKFSHRRNHFSHHRTYSVRHKGDRKVFFLHSSIFLFDPVCNVLLHSAVLSSIILPFKEFMIFHKINANYIRFWWEFLPPTFDDFFYSFSAIQFSLLFIAVHRNDFIIKCNDLYWKLHLNGCSLLFSCGSLAIPTLGSRMKNSIELMQIHQQKQQQKKTMMISP